MVLAAVLLIFSMPEADDTAKVAAESNAAAAHPGVVLVSDNASKDATLVAAALPSAPEPNAKAEAEPAGLRAASMPFLPVKSVRTRPHETPRQRKMWYALMFVSSGGAAFDAWSTRRAVSSGAGQESNPFLRPFANSNAMYAATQVSPVLMDFIGKRMMTSQHSAIRKIWWLPQVAGASLSFAAGAHNVGVMR